MPRPKNVFVSEFASRLAPFGLQYIYSSYPHFLVHFPIRKRVLARATMILFVVALASHHVPGQSTFPRALRTIIEVSYVNTDDELGTGMIGLGDINGDGKPDFAVGARTIRKAFVYFGGKDILDSTPDLTINGGEMMARGDFNGDGKMDLVTAARYNGYDTLFVYYGQVGSGLALDTIPGLTIGREAEGGGEPMFGKSFAMGDVNSDGFDDLIVGAPYFSSRGKVYVFLGRPNPSASPDFTVLCDSLGSHYGETIRTGDINGDGVVDLAIGSILSDRSKEPIEQYTLLDLYYGKAGWTFNKDNYDQRIDSRYGTRLDMWDFDLVDVNHDGKTDVSFGYGYSQYFILGRMDSVSHTPDSILAHPDVSRYGIFNGPFHDIGDINGDDVNDFAVRSNPGGGICLIVYLGGPWPEPIAARCKGFVGGNAYSIIVPVGDVDGSGVNDFATTVPYDALGIPPQDGYFIVLSGDKSFVTSVAPDARIPTQASLFQNYPNPFNPRTTIEYTLPRSGQVLLKIFDSSGKEVRTLVDEIQDGGFHSIQWDGRTDAGTPVASGAYFYTVGLNGKQLGAKKSLLAR